MYTRALLTTSAFVLLYGLIGQQHSTDAQWTGNRGSSLLGGGESAEAGGGSAQGGMMEMPSWMTFLRDFLRARMQEWRREQRRLQQQQTTTPPPPPPPALFPLDPWFGGPLARSTQDVLPDASTGGLGLGLGFGSHMGATRARGDSPVNEPTIEPEFPTSEPDPQWPSSEPEPETPVGEPEPFTIPPLRLPRLPRLRFGGGSSSASEDADFVDTNRATVEKVTPTEPAQLQSWECEQQGGMCVDRCDSPTYVIDIVDCGMGPRGRQTCCEV